MSELEKPWLNNPDAPHIPHALYVAEKEVFVGILLGAILYGTVICLFFQCLWALFNPANRARDSILRWGVVIYTVVMLLFDTVNVTMYLVILSLPYVGNGNFLNDAAVPAGGFGYILFLHANPVFVVSNAMFLLNNVLINGLSLYRCYIIYSRNHLVVIAPCLMYLVFIALGIAFEYEIARPENASGMSDAMYKIGLSFLSFSFLFNILLTSMVVARLILHNTKTQRATKVSGRPHMTIVSMIIESSVIYTVSFLPFLVSWAKRDSILYTFSPILANTEVIAPFLIILRVANRRTVLDNATDTGSSSLMEFRNQQELSRDDGVIHAAYPQMPKDEDGKTHEKLVIEITETVERHSDRL